MTDAPERIWLGRDGRYEGRPWITLTSEYDDGDVAEYTRTDLIPAMIEEQRAAKDGAYLERNRLVALLAGLFPSGTKRTAIEGWSEDWHGCVYIDFPWGQASWHYHDSQSDLFAHLPSYDGEWDGHSTEEKYRALTLAAAAIRARGTE